MKKSIFLFLNILQVYASILPYPGYETDLRKACPEPNYNQNCGCYGDYPCKEDETCCYTYCGRYSCQILQPTCPSPWYPGGCSTSTSTTSTPIPISVIPGLDSPITPQNITCDPGNFGSCPMGQECCSNGCSYECVFPDFICDYYNCNYEDCYDDFTGEDTCPDGFYCCYDGCEYKCSKPVYYHVSCPNDSIIEHEDVWTKFCLNDCNCPEYQLCCDSPCDCDLNICRDFIVQSATCPNYCDYDYNGYYCFSDDDCLGLNQLCCDCSYNYFGYGQCVDPVYGPPVSTGFIPIPIGIVPNRGSLNSLPVG